MCGKSVATRRSPDICPDADGFRVSGLGFGMAATSGRSGEDGGEVGDESGNFDGVGVFVHRMAAAIEDDEPGVRHLAFEVLARAGVLRSIGATRKNERWRGRLRESIHHHRVLLQVQINDAFGHSEPMGVAARTIVPAFPLLRVAEARTGVQHDNAARHIGPSRRVGQRQVTAE